MSVNKSICGRKKASRQHIKVFGSLAVFCFMFLGLATGVCSALAVEPSTAAPLRLKRIRSVHDKTFSAFIFKFDNKVQLAEPEVAEDAVIVKFKNATTDLTPYREYKTLDSWVALDREPEALTIKIGLPKNYLKYSCYLNRRQNKWIIKFHKTAPPPPPEKRDSTTVETAAKNYREPDKTTISKPPEAPVPEKPITDDSELKPFVTSESEKPKTPENPDIKTDNQKKPDAENQLTSNGLLTLNFYQSEIQEVLSALAMEREINIATAQDVSGKISVHLYQVTLAEALDAIVLAGGFQYKKNGDLYYIYKSEEIVEEPAESHQMKILKLRYAEMEKVQGILEKLPREGTIQTHAESKTIIVEDTPENIQKMETILGYLDQRPKQVMIEAKILQIGLTDDMAFGVDWAKILGDATIATGGFSRAVMPSTEPVNPVPGSGAGIFSNLITAIGTDYQFSMALDALQSKTRVNTLSTPKVLAIHGKSAKVQVGGQQGYRVTTTNLGVATETIEFIDTGTILDITPYIYDDGSILLQVLPSIQDAELQLGIPVVKTTSVSTWLMAKSGQTVLIGGLIKENKTKARDSIPLLGDIPGLGALFGRTGKNFKKEELVILITPRVLDDNFQYAEKKDEEKVGKAEEKLKKEPLPILEQLKDFIDPIE